jgi:EmrB/QacA subfamily drug resistance transporter
MDKAVNIEAETKAVGIRALPKRQVYITFGGVMLAMFLSSLDQTIVGTAMPRIISDLGGFTQYTWVTIAYMIASTVAVPITGKLIDMYGRKTLYLVGIGIFVLGSLLSGLSQTMTQIIAFRGFQGIGAGIMMAIAFTVIGDLFPPSERGKYQGMISAVFGLSSIVGPALGGFLTDSLSWHWVFFVNIPLGILIIVLFILFFPDIRPQGSKHGVDYWGVTTLILAVVPAMLALSWGGVDYPWLSVQIIGTFAFSIIMAVVFVIIEKRSKNPIIPLSLFRNKIVSISEIVVFLTAIGMFGTIIFVPLFFQGVMGMSATASGGFITPMMLGMVLGSFISGQILSRAGGHYRIQGAVGIAIMAVGMFLLSTMTLDTGYFAVVVNVVITGFGLGVTIPLYVIAVQNTVSYEVLGVATSSVAFFRSIGGSVGLAIFGSVINNRFAASFTSALSPSAKAMIPPQQLEFLVHNPQALVSVEAQTQLKQMFSMFGAQGTALFDQVLQVLRQALDFALTEVFLVGVGVLGAAFIVNLFIKEIPLRKQHVITESKTSPKSG